MSASAALSVVPNVLSHNPETDRTFEEVLDEVAKRSDLALPDQVVPLSRLRATDDGSIDVPGLGSLNLTVWSRRQLANLLGIRWDRWFSSDLIAPADRALEINRRFRASGETWKIRACRADGEKEASGQGVLRAFVSPTYGPIDDLEVMETMASALSSRLDQFRFVRMDVTAESSQYAAVSMEELDLGAGRADKHRNGFVVANSEVGSRALTFMAWIWRLVCTNGLVAPDSRLVRLIHRARKGTSMADRFGEAVRLLPERWKRAEDMLRRARQEPVEDPGLVMEVLVDSYPQLRPISDALPAAYEAEPEPTRFGIVQALTRAAQALTPERRIEVEEIAGAIAARVRAEEERF